MTVEECHEASEALKRWFISQQIPPKDAMEIALHFLMDCVVHIELKKQSEQ